MSDVVQQMELVRSGTRALDILRNRLFDLILLDIDMPVLNGIDTARHIRHSNEYDILLHNRTVPIVAVTTNDSAEWKRIYARVGMQAHRTKYIKADSFPGPESWVLPRIAQSMIV
ncbi:sensitivity to red-light reduced protein [Apophysomyces sp. BC1034]|nr:sensitivity to red-light reduced protein [Apophysomyces sp. BC1015]KAG0176939.1 sensitivity to red-light reduced protein [Apophysomyces sp. BC1021]KAG0184926.1 sensitivity to red-light reduced protein [Apophysomyces sp. BC1034]